MSDGAAASDTKMRPDSESTDFASRRQWPTVVGAAVFYVALALAFVEPALEPGMTLSGSDLLWTATPWSAVVPADWKQPANGELFDAATQYEPWRQYTAKVLPRIPLWNPYIMGGRPFLANSQSAIFSVFSLPSYVLSPGVANTVIAVAKLSTAGLGTFLLCRVLGTGIAGALLGGVIYAFGLFQTTNLSWPFTSVWVLIPWLMVCADLCARRPDARAAALLALVVGLQFFSGHPESSFHALFATSAFFVARLIETRSRLGPTRALVRRLMVFSVGCAAGAALAAIALVPFVELVLHSSDLVERQQSFGLPTSVLVMLFMPDWWGRPTSWTFGEPPVFFFCRSLYVGALPLMFAVAAPLLRPSLGRVLLALFACWALGTAVEVPFITGWMHALPIFATTNNARLAIIFLLCVAVLAGKTSDDLGRVAVSRSTAVLVLVAAFALVLAPLGWIGSLDLSAIQWPLTETATVTAANASQPSAEFINETRLASALRWIAVAGVAWTLLVVRLGLRRPSRWLPAVAIAIAAADLLHIGFGYNPAVKRTLITMPVKRGIGSLKTRFPNRFVGVGPTLLFSFVLTPNLSMQYGLLDARGYDFPVERRYDRLWRNEISPTLFSATRDVPQLDERALRALSLLSVSDIIAPSGSLPFMVPGLRFMRREPDVDAYANLRALPRTFVAHSQQIVTDEEAAWTAVTEPTFDPRRVVITERALPGVASQPPATETAARADIQQYEAERVVIAATTSQPGVLVLTDVAYPGWTATVDGQPAEVERVDYLLRGIPLSTGAHTVELRYRPWSYTIGAAMTLLTLVTLVPVLLFAGNGRSAVHSSFRT